jgi:hypothetical protein
MKKIYVVTHGDKNPGANPGLSKKGISQIEALESLLPKSLNKVICGTGMRHLDTADILNLEIDHYTSTVGGADSLEMIDGKKMILLANGTAVNPEKYKSLGDNTPSLNILLKSSPDNTIISAGRPCLIMMGYKDAKSGGLYEIKFEKEKIVSITEKIAQGGSEKGTV